jgi:hypothetical protein
MVKTLEVVIFILFFLAIPSVSYGEDYSHLENSHAPGRVDGKPGWIKCPNWDWSLIPDECKSKFMISINCLPKCGKYPGDRPDIGAWEYFPGITAEKPWGDWNGIPLNHKPGVIGVPRNFRKVTKKKERKW